MFFTIRYDDDTVLTIKAQVSKNSDYDSHEISENITASVEKFTGSDELLEPLIFATCDALESALSDYYPPDQDDMRPIDKEDYNDDEY